MYKNNLTHFCFNSCKSRLHHKWSKWIIFRKLVESSYSSNFLYIDKCDISQQCPTSTLGWKYMVNNKPFPITTKVHKAFLFPKNENEWKIGMGMKQCVLYAKIIISEREKYINRRLGIMIMLITHIVKIQKHIVPCSLVFT